MDFKSFETKYYDFYRFSSLVKDLIIIPKKISIPYDIEMKIIFNSYSRSLLKINSYELQVNYINKDTELLKELEKYNEHN